MNTNYMELVNELFNEDHSQVMTDRPMNYRLDGHVAVPVETDTQKQLLEWARWFETADRRVARTELPDGTVISTVFLGIDHNFLPTGKPLLFETMMFEHPLDECEQIRYSTWEDAEAGHQRLVDKYWKRVVTRTIDLED